MPDPKEKYQRREIKYTKLLKKQERAERFISNLRLLFFVLAIGPVVLMYLFKNYIPYAFALTGLIVIFIYLVIAHERLMNKKRITALLRQINTSSLKRMNGRWNTFADDGGDFKDDKHSFASDLDIFGNSSLFQYINTAKTYLGRHKLRQLLSGAVECKNEILDRQMAVNELARLIKWRQRFQAEAMMASGKMHNPDDIIAWGRESNEVFRKQWVIILVKICPVITVILMVTGFIMNLIPWFLPLAALATQYAFLSYKGKDRDRMLSISERFADDLRVYHRMLRHFEEQRFESKLIITIQEDLRSKKGAAAHKQIGRLSSIIDTISNRRNMLYLLFNILVLWDFQNIIALERWKRQSGSMLASWFDGLGRMEALASLAVIGFEHPDWAMPELCDEGNPLFEAKSMGHPLLSEERVTNDLMIKGPKKVLLITGSNMSGKSTLLRTAGINLVLAYAGAPVCAKTFKASLMEICSCMRVSDNLGENISSFYAELLRIKEMASKAEAGKRVFFLLDEVFKGTNSVDRHIGARTLINKLSATNAIGMVSTHDLEPCDLEKENKSIANYHFKEYYKDGKICFDYKLREGPSTTRNARYLMQLAGIDVAPEK